MFFVVDLGPSCKEVCKCYHRVEAKCLRLWSRPSVFWTVSFVFCGWFSLCFLQQQNSHLRLLVCVLRKGLAPPLLPVFCRSVLQYKNVSSAHHFELGPRIPTAGAIQETYFQLTGKLVFFVGDLGPSCKEVYKCYHRVGAKCLGLWSRPSVFRTVSFVFCG